MVTLYTNGKTSSEIISEYDLTPSTFHKRVKQNTRIGLFKEKDNLTPEQIELKKLEKENRQLRMGNDILKQAALIMGR
ncbi:MAG: hypothetical protein RR847_02595 [Bacilli bacterium]